MVANVSQNSEMRLELSKASRLGTLCYQLPPPSWQCPPLCWGSRWSRSRWSVIRWVLQGGNFSAGCNSGVLVTESAKQVTNPCRLPGDRSGKQVTMQAWEGDEARCTLLQAARASCSLVGNIDWLFGFQNWLVGCLVSLLVASYCSSVGNIKHSPLLCHTLTNSLGWVSM